ncbi:hypothetical protein ARMSODRAFT_1006582 [Armillaria solidipes]|uniref:F-box domain-containing protein n=1 Tax=Armillaria solidipes TaxID=1076256 RepID=A0A2H3B9B1_9AGAR|nr:hypothetical protein ARMSODRAFT_1006582 [Armillaria solidipes]
MNLTFFFFLLLSVRLFGGHRLVDACFSAGAGIPYALPRTTEFKSRTPPVTTPVKNRTPPTSTLVKSRIPPKSTPVKSSVPGNSSLSIPQELIEYIIDFLHDDVPTIRRCSFVSCAFLPRSRYHIYSNVIIVHTAELHRFRKQYAGQLYRSQNLLGLLARRPHIARLVTRFGMHAMSVPLFYEFMDTSFVSIISSLPNLSHLELVARGNQGFWKELSITTHKPFVTALRSCSLKTFIFNGISFQMPRRFDDVFTAVANPALKHLSLACDSGADDACRPFAPILPPPDGLPALLESLSISGAATARNIKWLFSNQSLYNVRGIQRLSLQLCNKATSSLIQRLLDETQATLEDFTLDGSAWSWAEPLVRLDLSRHRQLSSFFIIVSSPLDPLLSRTRLSPALRILTVEQACDKRKPFLVPCSVNPWGRFDAHLDKLKLPVLRNVHIRLHSRSHDLCFNCGHELPKHPDAWKHEVEENMPLHREKGILEVEVVKRQSIF